MEQAKNLESGVNTAGIPHLQICLNISSLGSIQRGSYLKCKDGAKEDVIKEISR